jgi:hypothetical protein
MACRLVSERLLFDFVFAANQSALYRALLLFGRRGPLWLVLKNFQGHD